jgi:serpin B
MNGVCRLRILRATASGLAVAAIMVSACGADVPGPVPVKPNVMEARPDVTVSAKPLPPVKRAPSNKADVASVVEGNNAFAFDLYAKLKGEKGNIIYSPYSISTALAMTYAGARGETAAEVRKTLRFAFGQEKLHPAMADLVDDLNSRGGDEGEGAYELVVANRLWGQAGYRFLAPFLGLNKAYYGAGLEQVDFARATERARKTINAWVEDRTREKIKELLKPGVLTPLTRLVLTNAIYFKGNWASEFKKERTSDAPFHVTPERTVNVPTMRQTAKFGYTDTPGLQVLEMPYVGGELSMVVLLPKKADGLAEFEATLSAAQLKTWVSRLRTRKVAVFLPKFKLEFGIGLAKTLAAMGMPRAFDDRRADFSGMDGTRELYISAVIHKAFVDVNEEGTEAAAATAVVIGKRSVSRLPVFRADRPFVFLIRDRVTGSVLFIGRVTDPSA